MRTVLYWLIFLPPALFLQAIWLGANIAALPVAALLEWLTKKRFDGRFAIIWLFLPTSHFLEGHKATRTSA